MLGYIETIASTTIFGTSLFFPSVRCLKTVRNPSSFLSVLKANCMHHDHLLKLINIYYIPMIYSQHLLQCLTQRRLTEGGVS